MIRLKWAFDMEDPHSHIHYLMDAKCKMLLGCVHPNPKRSDGGATWLCLAMSRGKLRVFDGTYSISETRETVEARVRKTMQP